MNIRAIGEFTRSERKCKRKGESIDVFSFWTENKQSILDSQLENKNILWAESEVVIVFSSISLHTTTEIWLEASSLSKKKQWDRTTSRV